MTSDLSDDDHDVVHFMDYPNCVEEDENQNVGLIVEDFKYTKGDKGKITMNHCNPRVLQDDPYRTLSKKISNANAELDELIKEFLKFRQKAKTLRTEF